MESGTVQAHPYVAGKLNKAAHIEFAVGAWLAYGKGRHPGALNFGDCLAYATAKMADLPLLCVGDDFSQTDLILA